MATRDHAAGSDEITPAPWTLPTVDWRVAVHESGHALAATVLGVGRVNRVAITGIGGQTDRIRAPTQTRLEDLEREIATMMAGRAAERLVLGDVTAGSGGDETSDLGQATRLAVAIETQLGLGETGPVWHGEDATVLLRSPQLFSRVRARVEAAEERAIETLRPHIGSVRALAARLVAERELTGEELRQALLLPMTPKHGATIAPTFDEAASCP